MILGTTVVSILYPVLAPKALDFCTKPGLTFHEAGWIWLGSQSPAKCLVVDLSDEVSDQVARNQTEQWDRRLTALHYPDSPNVICCAALTSNALKDCKEMNVLCGRGKRVFG